MSSRGVRYYVDRQVIGKTVVSNTTSKDAATISELMATPYRTFERKSKDGKGYRPEIGPNRAAKEELDTSHAFLKKTHAIISKFHEDLQMIRKRKAEAISYDDSSSSDDELSYSQERSTKKRSFHSSSCSDDNSSHCQGRPATKRCKLWDHAMFKPQSERLANADTTRAIAPKITLKLKSKSLSPKIKLAPKITLKMKSKSLSPKIKLVTAQARLEEATKVQQTLDCANRLREHARWNDCVAEPSPEFLERKKRMEKDHEEDEGDDERCPGDSDMELLHKKIAEKFAASKSHTAFWQERSKACEQPCTPPAVAAKLYQNCITKEIRKPGINPEKINEIQAKYRNSLHEKYPRDPQRDANRVFKKAQKIANVASEYVDEKADTANLLRKAEADIAMAKEEGVGVCIKPISAIPMRVRHLYKQDLPKAEKFIC